MEINVVPIGILSYALKYSLKYTPANLLFTI